MRADREHGRHILGECDRFGHVAAGAAQQHGRTGHDAGHAVVGVGQDGTVVTNDEIGDRRQPSGSIAMGSPERLPEVATSTKGCGSSNQAVPAGQPAASWNRR